MASHTSQQPTSPLLCPVPILLSSPFNYQRMHAMQVDLMSCIKQILFPAAVESLFGAAFLHHHGSKRLQKAFFAFEAGFELAASPVPHFLQPSFCQGRRALLEAFRCTLMTSSPSTCTPLPCHRTSTGDGDLGAGGCLDLKLC